ncbi:hypothetical protein BC828DRAFT_387043, partial [Blastocladiella britannica]
MSFLLSSTAAVYTHASVVIFIVLSKCRYSQKSAVKAVENLDLGRRTSWAASCCCRHCRNRPHKGGLHAIQLLQNGPSHSLHKRPVSAVHGDYSRF